MKFTIGIKIEPEPETKMEQLRCAFLGYIPRTDKEIYTDLEKVEFQTRFAAEMRLIDTNLREVVDYLIETNNSMKADPKLKTKKTNKIIEQNLTNCMSIVKYNVALLTENYKLKLNELTSYEQLEFVKFINEVIYEFHFIDNGHLIKSCLNLI